MSPLCSQKSPGANHVKIYVLFDFGEVKTIDANALSSLARMNALFQDQVVLVFVNTKKSDLQEQLRRLSAILKGRDGTKQLRSIKFVHGGFDRGLEYCEDALMLHETLRGECFPAVAAGGRSRGSRLRRRNTQTLSPRDLLPCSPAPGASATNLMSLREIVVDDGPHTSWTKQRFLGVFNTEASATLPTLPKNLMSNNARYFATSSDNAGVVPTTLGLSDVPKPGPFPFGEETAHTDQLVGKALRTFLNIGGRGGESSFPPSRVPSRREDHVEPGPPGFGRTLTNDRPRFLGFTQSAQDQLLARLRQHFEVVPVLRGQCLWRRGGAVPGFLVVADGVLEVRGWGGRGEEAGRAVEGEGDVGGDGLSSAARWDHGTQRVAMLGPGEVVFDPLLKRLTGGCFGEDGEENFFPETITRDRNLGAGDCFGQEILLDNFSLDTLVQPPRDATITSGGGGWTSSSATQRCSPVSVTCALPGLVLLLRKDSFYRMQHRESGLALLLLQRAGAVGGVWRGARSLNNSMNCAERNSSGKLRSLSASLA